MAIVMISCDQVVETPIGAGEIRIRIKNNSEKKFLVTQVTTSTDSHTYRSIRPGAMSSYKRYQSAYRYAYIELVSGTDLFYQPIDYVGESLLEPGFYTYELTLHNDNNKNTLRLKLIRD